MLDFLSDFIKRKLSRSEITLEEKYIEQILDCVQKERGDLVKIKLTLGLDDEDKELFYIHFTFRKSVLSFKLSTNNYMPDYCRELIYKYEDDPESLQMDSAVSIDSWLIRRFVFSNSDLKLYGIDCESRNFVDSIKYSNIRANKTYKSHSYNARILFSESLMSRNIKLAALLRVSSKDGVIKLPSLCSIEPSYNGSVVDLNIDGDSITMSSPAVAYPFIVFGDVNSPWVRSPLAFTPPGIFRDLKFLDRVMWNRAILDFLREATDNLFKDKSVGRFFCGFYKFRESSTRKFEKPENYKTFVNKVSPVNWMGLYLSYLMTLKRKDYRHY